MVGITKRGWTARLVAHPICTTDQGLIYNLSTSLGIQSQTRPEMGSAIGLPPQTDPKPPPPRLAGLKAVRTGPMGRVCLYWARVVEDPRNMDQDGGSTSRKRAKPLGIGQKHS